MALALALPACGGGEEEPAETTAGGQATTTGTTTTQEEKFAGKQVALGEGSDPVAVAFGEGFVWVADANGAIYRLDPRSEQVRRIKVGVEPSDVAVGGGYAWVANAGDGTVTRVSPEGETTRIRVGGAPQAVTVGRTVTGEAVWVANGDGTVSEISIDAAKTVGDPIRLDEIGSGDVTDIAVSDGVIWVATQFGLWRIDTFVSGGATVFKVKPRLGGALGATEPCLAVGEGGVWTAGDYGVGRLTDQGEQRWIAHDPDSDFNAPFECVAVGGGSLWAVGSDLPGMLYRIDPQTGSYGEVPVSDNAPGGPAFGAGAAWVLTGGGLDPGSITRVAPSEIPAG